MGKNVGVGGLQGLSRGPLGVAKLFLGDAMVCRSENWAEGVSSD